MKKIVVHPDVSVISLGEEAVQIRSPNKVTMTTEEGSSNLIELLNLFRVGMNESALKQARSKYSANFVDSVTNELIARGVLVDEADCAPLNQFQSLLKIYDIGGGVADKGRIPGEVRVQGDDQLAALAKDVIKKRNFPKQDGPILNVVVSGSNDLSFLLDENARSIEDDQYCTFLRWRDGEFLLGPFMVPGHTSCLLCAETRLVANSLNPIPSKFVLDHKLSFSRFRGGSVLSSFAQGILERHVEAITAGSWGLARAGSILRFDPIELNTSTARVLKVPNCEACGNATDRPEQALRDLI